MTLNAPLLTVTPASGDEDSAIALSIGAELLGADPSASLIITIAGVPPGATLSAGTDNGDGSWRLSREQLAGLTITPPADFSGSFDLLVTAGTLVGDDELAGRAAAEATVAGNAGRNFLRGGKGDDVLDGGAGGDRMAGRAGDDIYFVDDARDRVFERGGDGRDTVVASVDHVLAGEVEDLVLVGSAGLAAAGNGLDNRIAGNAGNNAIDGGEGSDEVVYRGAYALYAISVAAGTVTVDGALAGEGVDTLRNVETIAFADGVYTVADGSFTPAEVPVAETEDDLRVLVAPVADAPTLTVADAAGGQDTAIPLVIAAALTDVDGSEVLSLTVAGLPEGATLSAGARNADGSWSVPSDQLAGLTLTPPQGFAGEMALTVTARATEGANGAAAANAATLTVAVEAAPAPDPTPDPVLAVEAAVAGAEDAPVALTIAARSAVVISGLPEGASLSAGTRNADGSWTVEPEQLAGLTLTPPADSDASFRLTVTIPGEPEPVEPIIPPAPPAATVRGTTAGQTLLGTSGSDVIDGGGGYDTVIGTGGDDVYLLDGGDRILELPGQGTDRVYSSASHTLSLNVEDLVLTGTADVNATGNVGDNLLAGNAGSNVIDGRDGTDTAVYFGRRADHVVERLASGEWQVRAVDGSTGTDTIRNVELLRFADAVVDLATGAETRLGAEPPPVAAAAIDVALSAVADQPTLSVADAAGRQDQPVALQVAAALTDTDGSESLSVVVGGVPDGASLSAGTRNTDGSWSLTGDQLQGLQLIPAAGFSGGIDLTVTAVATEAGNGSIDNSTGNLRVNIEQIVTTPTDPVPTPVPQDPLPDVPGVVRAPMAPQPAAAGDIVGMVLRNTTSAAEPAQMVTFGQVFQQGQVMPGTGLVAKINGTTVPVQMDVKATNDDGSVRHAILTLKAPELAPGAKAEVMLAKGAGATGAAIAPADILARGYDVKVDFNIKSGDSVTGTKTVDVAALLRQAIDAGKVDGWMSGPNATEVRVEAAITSKLTAYIDIRATADGNIRTDVAVANDWTYKPGISTVTYDVAIKQGGATVWSQANIEHHRNATWHQEVWKNGAPDVQIVRDMEYLMKTGAVQMYDTSHGVNEKVLNDTLAALAAKDTGPMGEALITKAMPMAGGRPDIGPHTTWTARYLESQDPRAEKVLMEIADAAGSVPWHFRDEATGEALSIDEHPRVWIDPRGSKDPGYYGDDALPEPHSYPDGWNLDVAHQPELTYVPYILTGSRYYLDEVVAQGSFTLARFWPVERNDSQGLVDNLELRATAWGMRALGNAAYALPDDHPMKAYFEQKTEANLDNFIKQYITDGIRDGAGAVEGYMKGYYTAGVTPPWQNDYVATVLGTLAQRGYDKAGQTLDWMENFLSGRYINGDNGFDPMFGAAYTLNTSDPATGRMYSTWKEVFDKTFGAGATRTTLDNYPDWAGGHAAVSKAGIAAAWNATGNPDALEAWGFAVSQTPKMTADYRNDPAWAVAPKLADGSFLKYVNVRLATNTAGETMTGTERNEMLHGNDGSDTLSGGAGIDLLYGGKGNDTLDGGQGGDFLFGGPGNDRLNGGAGNDWLKGNAGADTFVFAQAGGGKDTIADFRAGTDRLEVKAGLNGGPTTAAQVVSTATLDAGGNLVLHLGGDEVTLLGVKQLDAGSVSIV